MAPPVEEMKTRGVSLVVSDMIRHGRYKPIITGRKLGYQRTLSRTERHEAARARTVGPPWKGSPLPPTHRPRCTSEGQMEWLGPLSQAREG